MKRARLDEEEAEEAVPLLLVRPARVATGTPTAPPPALRLPAPAAVRDARPVFLSKAQRVAAAAAEVEAQKAAAAAEARLQQQAPRRADAAPREQRRDARPDGRSRRSDVAVPVPAPAAPATFAAPSAAELAELRAQYLGEAVATKRKQGKPADRFRFVFDWGAEQDTSRPAGAGVATHEASLQFGRGLRAGVDRAQQRSLGATHAQALLDKQRASAGAAPETQEQAATARARLGAALEREARYDKVRPQPQLASWRDKPLAEMTDRDWRIFREDHAIGLKGGKLPLPFRSWAEAPLPEPILRAVEAVGYTRPSPIQMAAIPIGVAGRDVIGIAETGSGKTCAFVLPMLAYIMRLPVMAGDEAVEALGPYALVLSPTRELAQQTEEETAKFAKFLNYRAVSIVGGQNIEEQGFALRNGCEIVIGTPGRVLDCLERRYTVLHQCNFVVMDEADRMIDYGFEPQVIRVLDAMPSSNLKPAGEEEAAAALQEEGRVYRTTFMFSATMPPVVERLARTYMRHAAVVTIGSAGKAASAIRQNVYMARTDDKPALLEREMARAGDAQVIVFVNSHKVCDYIGKVMERLGKATCVLHGGKTQDAREFAIEGYRAKRYQVLIATDVAGRGIDIPDVGLVINYQMPATIEAYTHRIGRTGRAGKKGVAASFVTPEDQDLFFDLRVLLSESGNEVPPELAAHPAARKKPQKTDFGRDIDK